MKLRQARKIVRSQRGTSKHAAESRVWKAVIPTSGGRVPLVPGGGDLAVAKVVAEVQSVTVRGKLVRGLNVHRTANGWRGWIDFEAERYITSPVVRSDGRIIARRFQIYCVMASDTASQLLRWICQSPRRPR